MKEKPILFSGPMARAILDGTKTQTRRVVESALNYRKYDGMELAVLDGKAYITNDDLAHFELLCPYGQPGDRLWVRETWGWVGDHHHEDHRSIYWKADRGDWPKTRKWRPSIFMPRWASRLTLEVTDIRVQRVQEISEGDAKAEGATPSIVGDELDHLKYRAGFMALWDSINAKRGFGWDVNPWVWAISVKRVV